MIHSYGIATQWKTFDETVYNIYDAVNLYLDNEDIDLPEWIIHQSIKETISMKDIVASLSFDFTAIKYYSSYPKTNAHNTQEHMMAV